MRNGRSKLNIPYLVAAIALLVVVVFASLYFFPEWRESPAMIIALLVIVAVGVAGFAANFTSTFIRDSADTPPAALDYDTPQHRRNQENVCANVRGAWIDGVLRDSLQERVRLELALDSPPGMLQRTIRPVEGQESRRPLESAADIADIYRAGARSLLILGAPGSGKTMTLLELCRPILEGAEVDPRRPVPVVLNLSTWAQKQAPLAEWIADEMRRQYDLSRSVTPVWLAADHLTLLLDGLDEVAADARDACVRAINAFRETHSAGMAICSRSADYADLRERLALSKAVEILPLTPTQIAAYLSDERLALDGVREAITRDDALGELATTPLMLNVMAVAYGGRPLAELLPLLDSETRRRSHLYDAYIARMFSRKPLDDAGYTAAQALRWLRFLAARLTERGETQFFIEDLQPDWLPRKGRYLGPGPAVLKPVDEFPIILEPRLQLQIIMDRWPLLGLIVVLGGYLGFQLGNKISYVLIGILVSIGFTLWIGFMTRMLLEWRGRTLSFFSSVPYNDKSREENRYYKSVGQGIRRSSQNAILIVAVGGIITVLPFFMFLGILESVINSTGNFRIVVAVAIGLFYWVIIFGLSSGGLFVLMHYALRLLLALHHLLPLRLVPFLEAMRERIFLQRAGGHYRFIHRTLQEHIAALTDDRIERLT